MTVDSFTRAAAAAMLDELNEYRLETVLIPSDLKHQPTARQRRVNVNENPLWYQRLCAMYPKQRTRPRNRRKPDTLIVRSHVQRALRELAAGRCETLYAARLLPFCEERAHGRDAFIWQPVHEIVAEVVATW